MSQSEEKARLLRLTLILRSVQNIFALVSSPALERCSSEMSQGFPCGTWHPVAPVQMHRRLATEAEPPQVAKLDGDMKESKELFEQDMPFYLKAHPTRRHLEAAVFFVYCWVVGGHFMAGVVATARYVIV